VSIFRCADCSKIFDISQQQSIDLGMNYCPHCFNLAMNRIANYNTRINEAIINSRSEMLIESNIFVKEEPQLKNKKKQSKPKYDSGRQGKQHGR